MISPAHSRTSLTLTIDITTACTAALQHAWDRRQDAVSGGRHTVRLRAAVAFAHHSLGSCVMYTHRVGSRLQSLPTRDMLSYWFLKSGSVRRCLAGPATRP